MIKYNFTLRLKESKIVCSEPFPNLILDLRRRDEHSNILDMMTFALNLILFLSTTPMHAVEISIRPSYPASEPRTERKERWNQDIMMTTSALCLKYYLLWYPFKAPYRVEYCLQLSTPHPNSPYEYPSLASTRSLQRLQLY